MFSEYVDAPVLIRVTVLRQNLSGRLLLRGDEIESQWRACRWKKEQQNTVMESSNPDDQIKIS